MNKKTEKTTNAKREKQMHELWNERGYDKPYLSKLNDKDLDVLWATEFYHEKMATGGNVVETVKLYKNKSIGNRTPDYNFSNLINSIVQLRKETEETHWKISFTVPDVAEFILTDYRSQIIPIGNIQKGAFQEGSGTHFDSSILGAIKRKSKNDMALILNLMVRNCSRAALVDKINFEKLVVEYKGLEQWGYNSGEHDFNPKNNSGDFKNWVEQAPTLLTSRGSFSPHKEELLNALEQLNNLLPDVIIATIKKSSSKMATGGGVDEKVIFNLDTYELRYKGAKDKAESWVEYKGTMMNRLGYSFDGHNFKTVKAMKEYYKKHIDSKMATGGSVDEVITINIDGYPYYLKKMGDTTHFRMANSKDGVDIVIPSHIGQYRSEPYYSDIASWLKGGASPDGKSYTESKYAKGGSMYGNGGVIEKELSDLEFNLKATENSLKWVQQQTSVTNQFYKRKVQNGKMTRERARKLMDEASVSWAKQREEEREKIKNIKAKIERLMALREKISKSEYATGGNITDGVVGQEILFDYMGEEKTGVIREVTNAGDYVVNTDDNRTVLAQVDRDVLELRGMRKKAAPETPRKLFGFFEDGGNVDSIKYSSNIASTWYTPEVITSDLKKYIVEAYNRGGDDLAESIVNSIQRAINEARNLVDGSEPNMPSQFTPVEQEWTKDDQNGLEGLISDIQDGMGWISPDYVETSWTERRGNVGTRDWNPAIARKVYQEMIDADILYADNENEPGEKVYTVSEAIEYAQKMG
jgi:hypothetical protein